MIFLEIENGIAVVHSKHSLKNSIKDNELFETLNKLPLGMMLSIDSVSWIRLNNIYTRTKVTPVISN